MSEQDWERELARIQRDLVHIRAALTIAHKHRDESQAWADVVTLLEDIELAQ